MVTLKQLANELRNRASENLANEIGRSLKHYDEITGEHNFNLLDKYTSFKDWVDFPVVKEYGICEYTIGEYLYDDVYKLARNMIRYDEYGVDTVDEALELLYEIYLPVAKQAYKRI